MIVRDLTDVIKHVPPLAPDDSAARAVRVMKARGVPAAPVAVGSTLVGMVTEDDLVSLHTSGGNMREVLRNVTAAEVMKPITLIAAEHQTLGEIADGVRLRPVAAIPVAASDGRYLGIVLPRDLLGAMAGEPVVPPIAGLATPLGVYLTTGALRAGATDLGLVATGAALMVMNLCATGAATGMGWLASRLLHSAHVRVTGGASMAVAAALFVLEVAIFLLLLRLSPLTGIHAAEHMVVRAVEEGEDLTLEKVRQMPRVHPRCGTNLMALVVLLLAAYQLVESIQGAGPELGALALVILVVLVAFTWRRLGAGLQRLVTTKRPSDRQLEAAIRVGESLLARVGERPSARVATRERIWHTGFIQVLAGFFLVALAVEYGPHLAAQVWHLLEL